MTATEEIKCIVPKNKQQEAAIAAGKAFIENGNPDEFFVIVGKAGTGKTTIAEAILKDYVGRKSILICALSHKAKLVLGDKLTAAFGSNCVITKSVAGALGVNMDLETGKFKVDAANNDPAIKKASIIVIDEGSMINEESHRLIMTEKKKKSKVLYLGDIRQLPPIRENSDPNKDNPSPVFFSKNIAVLNERIRQGEDSPILPFSDFFGDNSRKKYALWNPVPANYRKDHLSDKGALVFAKSRETVIEAVYPLYRAAVDSGNVNIVKLVSYRNETRKSVNLAIRYFLFEDDSLVNEYIAGDLIMFADNHPVEDFEEPISNSFEVQISEANKGTDNGYKVWKLGFVYESKPITVLTLEKSDVKRHAGDVSAKFEYAKKLPFGSRQRSEALSQAWELKNRYASVEHAYAITSHKAQGSTYNTVVVDEMDIMNVKLTSNKAKSQSMYTAITRAATTCIVVDGISPGENVQQAVEFSMKQLTYLQSQHL